MNLEEGTFIFHQDTIQTMFSFLPIWLWAVVLEVLVLKEKMPPLQEDMPVIPLKSEIITG